MPVTLALIKPEALKNGYAPAIEATIEAQKFSIIARAEVTLLPEQAAELYEEFAGTALFAAMCAAVTSGPIVALAIDKADAQAAWSELIGPVDPAAAREEAPLSLRAVYGTDIVQNALHGSTSAAAAFREVKLFFPKTCPRELTVCLIKPDGLDSADAVLAEAEADGFLLVSQKRLTLSHEQAAQFLSGSVAAAELEAAAAHLSSGEVVAAALERSFGIEHCLAMLERSSAKTALYGSATAAAAARDVAFLFGADLATKPETTFAMVKPDAYADADAVIAVAESHGFTVLASQTVEMSAAVAADFYKEHKGRDYFQPLVDFMASGPALAMVLMRPGAISAWRALCGPTDSIQARTVAPLSIRAQFGTNGQRNACHGSDSTANAAREAGMFFPFLEATQTTLGLALPHAVASGHVDALLAAAAAANLVVTQRLVTKLDRGRAEDFVDMLGAGAPPKAPPAAAAEPFISAWAEGGKCNKFLQLYNPSDEVVDLAGYATPMMGGKGARGGGMPTSLNPLPPGKSIPPRGVFVIYHPEASAEIKASLPVDARHSMAFDGLSKGDAAIALAKLHVFANGQEPVLEEGTPPPFTVLDWVGDFSGANKGRPWAVAGTAAATKDHTIVRKSHVGRGNAVLWVDATASSQGSGPENSEWTVYKKNTIAAPELGWSATEWRAEPGPPPPPPAGSYEAMVEALSAGPMVAFALSGKGAIARWNALLGPSTPALAKVRCPGCLRARFGVDASEHAAHGSATAAASFRELKFFFPKAVVDPLPSSKQAKEYVAETLTPTLTAGLVELCKVKPEAPVEWLANWLVANNPNTPQI